MPAKGRDLAPPTYAREFTLQRQRDCALDLVAFMLVLVAEARRERDEARDLLDDYRAGRSPLPPGVRRRFDVGAQGLLPGVRPEAREARA